jgi:hypothetical protein
MKGGYSFFGQSGLEVSVPKTRLGLLTCMPDDVKSLHKREPQRQMASRTEWPSTRPRRHRDLATDSSLMLAHLWKNEMNPPGRVGIR